MIFEIGNTLVSSDLLDKSFVCHLKSCKGMCCVEGDAGAPLEVSELPHLENVYAQVKPYMTQKGIEVVETKGKYIKSSEGEWETPLVDRKECVYAIFTSDGTALCSIEKAYELGKIPWIKPLSCHLYPVRIAVYEKFVAINYHRWDICQSACSIGHQGKTPLYKFLKTPLIRRFGKDWYKHLEVLEEEFYRAKKD